MAKKVTGYIKLQVPAGKATPQPPIGPALGQAGLNIMAFCREFNAQTQKLEEGMPVPVVITAFADHAALRLREDAARPAFAEESGREGRLGAAEKTVGKVTQDQIRQIAEQKMADLNAKDIGGAIAMVIGSARSMGIEVVD